MACRLFGTKPITEPMLTKFTDAYMRHQGGGGGGGDELVFDTNNITNVEEIKKILYLGVNDWLFNSLRPSDAYMRQ